MSTKVTKIGLASAVSICERILEIISQVKQGTTVFEKQVASDAVTARVEENTTALLKVIQTFYNLKPNGWYGKWPSTHLSDSLVEMSAPMNTGGVPLAEANLSLCIKTLYMRLDRAVRQLFAVQLVALKITVENHLTIEIRNKLKPSEVKWYSTESKINGFEEYLKGTLAAANWFTHERNKQIESVYGLASKKQKHASRTAKINFIVKKNEELLAKMAENSSVAATSDKPTIVEELVDF